MRESDSPTLWRTLRSAQPALAARFAVSLALGAALAGLGLIAVWTLCILAGMRPRDEHVAAGLLSGAVLWLAGLILIWAPVRGSGGLLKPAILSAAIAIAAVLLGIVLESMIRWGEEMIIAGELLLAGAIVVLVWLRAIHDLRPHQPVVSASGTVNVHCPSCQYSLVGLTELRCPECGRRFTIDELIALQGYGK